MDKTQSYILWFNEICLKDVALVGGKNAALGEMYQNLVTAGLKVPNGFAITSIAYDHFLNQNGAIEKIKEILKDLNTQHLSQLQSKGEAIRKLIRQGQFPLNLQQEIVAAYLKLKSEFGQDLQVAVRSSATAEDLPNASFAGQQETYLNISGEDTLLARIKDCFASLFTNRAISYRADKGFDQLAVKLSVGVQKMIRSDLAAAGVTFTIDPDSGLDKVVVINSVFGLGELIVQGKVIPDEFIVFKDGVKKKLPALISKKLGHKDKKIIYGRSGNVMIVATAAQEQANFSLVDEEVVKLAQAGLVIEEHFGKAMDIEWAKDGLDGQLYIIQARPETVHSTADRDTYFEYRLKKNVRPALSGIAVGSKIAAGPARVIKDVTKIREFQRGEILVTEMTDPDWEPVMKLAAGIITERGGRTCHAAIVARELGIPAIVGVPKATTILKTGEAITINCAAGTAGEIYKEQLLWEMIEHKLAQLPKIKTEAMVNIGSPEEAFALHSLPVKGVGLAREEFIIASEIKIHPMALVEYQELKNQKADVATSGPKLKINELVRKIDELTVGYPDKRQYYVDKLASGIALIAAAFYPNEVIVRFSDFKTNEYRNLLGGELYEPDEANPMLGWRGASRYYHPRFQAAFELECQAVRKAIEEWGLGNIVVMVPFCRTVTESRQVMVIIRNYLKQRVYMMCEVPSNILQAEEFLEVFDGFSIGSNDLTQLVLGLDRDSAFLTQIADETNEAVKRLMGEAIKAARAKDKYIGICGQAPSDFPSLIEFLVKEGISSISFNPDAVLKGIGLIAQAERNLSE